MPILPNMQGPEDLRGLDEVQLAQLAVEIRDTIVRTVASTGGHLGSSLGVVELTIALHRLLESPRDRIVWDTGHQAYPHKLLTGRFERFGTLRQLDGVGRLPASLGVAARRLRRWTRGDRPVDRRGSRRGARPASRPREDRRRRRRCGPDERALARGAQRHRPAPDADADRGQRQRDVDQPDRRGVLDVPVEDQAVAHLAPEQERVRPDRRTRPGGRPAPPGAVEAAAGFGRPVRPAGPAVRGPRDHLHRGRAGARSPRAAGDAEPRAGAAGADHRPRPDPEGPRLPAGRDRPGRLPRGGAAADRDGAGDRRVRRVADADADRVDDRRRGAARPGRDDGDEEPELHGGLRGRAHRACPDRSAHRRDHGRHADRDRDVQVPGRVPGPDVRRRDRRAALDGDGHRPGDGRDAAGRRALFDVPPARLRPDRPRRLPERPAGADRGRPVRAGRGGRHEPPGDVHAAGAAPDPEPRHRVAEGRAGAAVAASDRRSRRTIRSPCTTRATAGSGWRR